MSLNSKSKYLKIKGEYACFTNPLLKVERVSYPVPTPSALRGVLESLYYKPEFRYEIDAVAVKKPIQFQSFRRNEVKSIISRNMTPINISEDRTQRNSQLLRDVEYVIQFRIVFKGSPIRTDGNTNTINTCEKYHNSFDKYIARGHIRRTPCMGCKEFICDYEVASESDMIVDKSINNDSDFGVMLYDCYNLDEHNSKPMITTFESKLRSGIVQYPSWEIVKLRGLSPI